MYISPLSSLSGRALYKQEIYPECWLDWPARWSHKPIKPARRHRLHMKVESISADVLMPLAAPGAPGEMAVSASDALTAAVLVEQAQSGCAKPSHVQSPSLVAGVAGVEVGLDDAVDEEDVVDDAELSRSTYIMGMVEEAGQETDIPSPKPSPRYVQGVIRGHQAYMITNLVGAASQTLLQPQMLWTLGRNREAALAIKDRMMSRRHAVIVYDRQDECFYLADLASLNGSYVNGVRLKQRHKLQDGDFLRVGNTEFFFFSSGGYESLEALQSDDYAKLVQDHDLLSKSD
jgi:FHA domain